MPYEPPETTVERSYEPDRLYILASNVEVLDEIHNCEILVERIRRSKAISRMLDESEVGSLGTYIIQGRGEAGVSYWVESGIATILALFTSPRSCRVAARWLAQKTQMAGINESIFEPLLSRGILVGAPCTPLINGTAES